jgi:hypothetical protein
MDILKNELIHCRLKAEPEFITRLSELVVTKELEPRPCLVLQARPVQGTDFHLDLSNAAVARTIRGGMDESHSSWDGFFAQKLERTFHGVEAKKEGWCFEAHRDGHFIAAAWDFPQLPRDGGQVTVLPDYYVNFISDFFGLIASVFNEAKLQAKYCATATVLMASELSYVAYLAGNRSQVAAQTPQLDTLQWPVTQGDVGSERWKTMCLEIADGLCGAYGHRSPLR